MAGGVKRGSGLGGPGTDRAVFLACVYMMLGPLIW